MTARPMATRLPDPATARRRARRRRWLLDVAWTGAGAVLWFASAWLMAAAQF